MNRNLVLVWEPFGKVVDAAVNYPGNFHDSRSTLWSNIYNHMATIPDGFKCACDSAFYTGGRLADKLVKTNEEFVEGMARSEYDSQLTHLRQASE